MLYVIVGPTTRRSRIKTAADVGSYLKRLAFRIVRPITCDLRSAIRDRKSIVLPSLWRLPKRAELMARTVFVWKLMKW